MYSRRRIRPLYWMAGIVVVLVLLVLVVGRLDFPGWILRGISGLVPSKPAAQYTQEEVDALKSKAAGLEQQNTFLNEMVLEAQRLQGLSQLKNTVPYDLLNAKIIYRDYGRLFDTAIIDRGSYDGVQVEMPVIDSDGLVGRVVATRAAVSRIVLLTSPDCSFGVIDQRSRDLGIIRGTQPVKWTMKRTDSDQLKPNMLDLQYLSPSAQISVQDILITSGLSGVTPQGLRVGEVVEIISHEEEGSFNVRVRPFADFEHLENVSVVLFKEKDLADFKELTSEMIPPSQPDESPSDPEASVGEE
jgi:rod shape-determining protein MreC